MAEAASWGQVALAYGLIFSVQIVFCGYQILAKVAISGRGINPVAFALIRAIGTTVSLLIVSAWEASQCVRSMALCGVPGPPARLRPKWEHKWHFLLLGVCVFCNVLGLILALHFTTSSMVAILQVMRPIFAALVGRALGLEQLSKHKYSGMVLCIIGAIEITAFGSHAAKTGDNPIIGAILVAFHAIGQALGVILQPALMDFGYSAFIINAYAFAVAAVLFAIVVVLPIAEVHVGVWWDRSAFFIGVTLYSILLVGAYSYTAMGWAAKKVGGTAVMLFMLLQAGLTVGASSVVFHDQFHTCQLQGIAMLIVGMLIFALGPAESSKKDGLEAGTKSEKLPLLKGQTPECNA